MKVELAPEEIDLLRLMLSKEFEETRVEIHHAKNIDFKTSLHDREKVVRALLEKLP
jgi:hypothetical protein